MSLFLLPSYIININLILFFCLFSDQSKFEIRISFRVPCSFVSVCVCVWEKMFVCWFPITNVKIETKIKEIGFWISLPELRLGNCLALEMHLVGCHKWIGSAWHTIIIAASWKRNAIFIDEGDATQLWHEMFWMWFK